MATNATFARGLGPYVKEKRNDEMKSGTVYILASKRDGTLYVGVTSNLAGRIWEHRTGAVPGFTKRYGVRMLVWFAEYADIREKLYRRKDGSSAGAAPGRSV